MEEYNLMKKYKYEILIDFLFDVTCNRLTYDELLLFSNEKINDILKAIEPEKYETKIREITQKKEKK